ncbi:MAG: DUF502 domain-containing protein [Candidatus Omnitrophica bacterium]|nr:DUF502 domain-containing protein [Candidatus Omnitrophota bacterium]
MKDLKKYFIAGLVVIVPAGLTCYVLFIVFQFIDSIIGKFLERYLERTLGFYVPGIGFFILLMVILGIGIVATRFFRNRVFVRFEQWFGGLPLVKSIYPALKQVVLFVSAQKELGFKSAVIVEYPCRGIWTVGFVTNDNFAPVNKATGKDMVAVFLPMSPNPLSGYVAFFARDEVKAVDMTVQEALDLIISGGVFSSKK